MKKLTSLMIGSLVLLGAAGCDVARTSADAPTSIDGEVKNPQRITETVQDSSKNIRRAQLNSDIRAREQQNNWSGNRLERSNSSLASEVRAKLEANIRGSKLAVQAEDGAVIIAGTVPSQREYETIEPLSKEILGVDSVDISRVEVVEPTES
jgi:hyperosmotically inducible periplasmic protein